jgi:hypothetical protein
MFTRCGKTLVVMALVLSTGLHWATLQTVAWTTMLADNLCNQSFTTAISQTFDGQHLCPLCRAIAAGKKAEKKSEAVAFKLKLEFPPLAGHFQMFSPVPVSAFSRARLFAESSFLKPPLPPPRSFFI